MDKPNRRQPIHRQNMIGGSKIDRESNGEVQPGNKVSDHDCRLPSSREKHFKKQIEKTAQGNLSAWLETQPRQIELRDDIAQTGTCSICGVLFTAWGNNAAPINGGRCCDCNNLVVARRQWVAETERATVMQRVRKLNEQQGPQ